MFSDDFEPESYEDEYQNRVRAMLDNKEKAKKSLFLLRRHPAGISST
jgi:non-homologous end joining protein Ku